MVKIGNQKQHFAATRGSPLLALPRELRDIIYGYVYAPTEVKVRVGCHKNAKIHPYRAMPPRLGAVCWQLRLETRHDQSKGHEDWYHRLALQKEIHQHMYLAPVTYNYKKENSIKVMLETPCHEHFNQMLLQIKGIGSYENNICISGRLQGRTRPVRIATIEGTSRHRKTTYHCKQSRDSVVLLLGEALLQIPQKYRGSDSSWADEAILALEHLCDNHNVQSQLPQPHIASRQRPLLRGLHLFDLPRGVRDRIYDYVYGGAWMPITRFRGQTGRIKYYTLPARLGAVSKQLRQETKGIHRNGETDWYHRSVLRERFALDFIRAHKDDYWKCRIFRFKVETPEHPEFSHGVVQISDRDLSLTGIVRDQDKLDRRAEASWYNFQTARVRERDDYMPVPNDYVSRNELPLHVDNRTLWRELLAEVMARLHPTLKLCFELDQETCREKTSRVCCRRDIIFEVVCYLKHVLLSLCGDCDENRFFNRDQKNSEARTLMRKFNVPWESFGLGDSRDVSGDSATRRSTFRRLHPDELPQPNRYTSVYDERGGRAVLLSSFLGKEVLYPCRSPRKDVTRRPPTSAAMDMMVRAISLYTFTLAPQYYGHSVNVPCDVIYGSTAYSCPKQWRISGHLDERLDIVRMDGKVRLTVRVYEEPTFLAQIGDLWALDWTDTSLEVIRRDEQTHSRCPCSRITDPVRLSIDHSGIMPESAHTFPVA